MKKLQQKTAPRLRAIKRNLDFSSFFFARVLPLMIISLICLSTTITTTASSLSSRLDVKSLQSQATTQNLSPGYPASSEATATTFHKFSRTTQNALQQQQQQQPAVKNLNDDASAASSTNSSYAPRNSGRPPAPATVIPSTLSADSNNNNNNDNNKTSRKVESQSRTTQAASFFKPPPLIELTTTTTGRPGLIARTSDAIIKTLSGYFSHGDEGEQEGKFGSKVTTTTSARSSALRMTTKWPETTTTTMMPSSSRRTSFSGGQDQPSVVQIRTTTTPMSTGNSKSPMSSTTRHNFASATSSGFELSSWAGPSRAETTGLPDEIATLNYLKPAISLATTTPHLDLGAFHDQAMALSTRQGASSWTPMTTTTASPLTSSRQTTRSMASAGIKPIVTTSGTRAPPSTPMQRLTDYPTFATNVTFTTRATVQSQSSPVAVDSKSATTTTTTTTTTRAPRPLAQSTSANPSQVPHPVLVTKIAPFSGKHQNESAPGNSSGSSRELLGFLSHALKSIEEFTYLSNRNRSTRLAPLHSDTDDKDNLGDQGEREAATEETLTTATTTTTTTTRAPSRVVLPDPKRRPSLSGALMTNDKLVQGTTESAPPPTSVVVASGETSAQQVRSREDVLFLCKLLHKHLESSKQNENGSITFTLDSVLAANLTSGSGSSSSSPTFGSITTSRPAQPKQPQVQPGRVSDSPETLGPQVSLAGSRLISDPQLELGELQHEDRLLESTFALDQLGQRQQRQNKSHEMAAEQLLYDLYNLGHRRKMAKQQHQQRGTATGETVEASDESSSSSSSAVAATPDDNASTTHVLPSSHQTGNQISLRVWSKTTTGGTSGGARNGGRLKLIYWLLEQVNLKSKLPKFRVLDFKEAGELLDQLDHALVQQLVDELALVRPIVLVAPHKKRANDAGEFEAIKPIVIDDTLTTGANSDSVRPSDGIGSGSEAAPGGAQQPNRNALQLLVDRLTQSSFSDNLYLYLILFIVLLFTIVMCISVPALCCKCMLPNASDSGALMAGGGASGPGAGRGANQRSSGLHQTRAARGGNGNGGQRRRGASRRRSGDANVDALGSSYNNQLDDPNRTTSSHYKSTDPLRESISSISGALAAKNGTTSDNASKHQNESAIWRKLSNSTTTLTKEQVRTLQDEGHLGRPVGQQEEEEEEGHLQTPGSKFEWYTFEDKQTLRKTTKKNVNNSSSQVGSSSSGGGGGGDKFKPIQTSSLVVHDQRKVTKSIQTYSSSSSSSADPSTAAAAANFNGASDHNSSMHCPPEATLDTAGQFNDSIDREHLSLAYRDRLETRNSDTLTKSELVMLKEKLIPIGRELRIQQEQQKQREQQQVGATSGAKVAQSHDYVNMAFQKQQQQQQQQQRAAARHIDSSVESAGNSNVGARTKYNGGHSSGARKVHVANHEDDADQRAPSMRYLELPAGMQGQLDAIRGELGRIEARDAELSPHSTSRTAPTSSCQAQQVPATGTGRLSSTDHRHQKQQSSGDTYKRYDVI